MIGHQPLHLWDGRHAMLEGGEERLRKVIQKSTKGWAATLPVDTLVNIVREYADGEQPVPHVHATVLAGSHLLLWGLASPWYAPGQVWLLEEFFLRVGVGSLDDALASLDSLAQEVHATGVVMATALARSDAALGRLLAARGYSPMNSQHFKTVGG